MTTNYALLFPGQGSQRVGMLGEMAEKYSLVSETFKEASEILGFDLWKLASAGPEEKIRQTEFTQPLMLASGVASGRLWLELDDERPSVVAGHSVGEIAALVVAGALSFDDSVRLVKERSRLMSAAVPAGKGGMAAVIGMDDADVVALCAEVTDSLKQSHPGIVVEAVNFNAPGQVVISGHLEGIEAVTALGPERGARKVMQVPVSVPNHSSLMQVAGETLGKTIDTVSWVKPTIPVMQNQNAKVAANADDLVATLRLHVQSPVLWVQSVESMVADFKVSKFVEMGPGKVLAGLGKRIDRSVETMPVFDPDSLGSAIDSLALSCAQA